MKEAGKFNQTRQLFRELIVSRKHTRMIEKYFKLPGYRINDG